MKQKNDWQEPNCQKCNKLGSVPARWREATADGDIVHCDGANGAGYTLCGLAYEGEAPTGHPPTDLTPCKARVSCPACVGIIRFCKRLPAVLLERGI